MTDTATVEQPQAIEAFTFGEPEAVLDRREIFDLFECNLINGEWYEMPVSVDGLSRMLRAGVHHASAIDFKAKVLASTFKPHRLLDGLTMVKVIKEYLVFGNAYLERPRNRLGETMPLKHSMAKYTRRHKDLQRFGFMPRWNEVHEFRPGSVCHIMEPDVDQEIYGVPQYLASLQSSLLNESATLFRRRYYTNGSHAGFILYLTDPTPNQQDVDGLRTALKSAKGIGNFRNLFFHSPNGQKDGIKLIPIGEATAKDEFLNIKNVSRDDQLAAHRVPPELIGVVPASGVAFGNVVNAARVFARNEIQPLQAHLSGVINAFMGDEVCRFDTYRLASVDEPQPQALK